MPLVVSTVAWLVGAAVLVGSLEWSEGSLALFLVGPPLPNLLAAGYAVHSWRQARRRKASSVPAMLALGFSLLAVLAWAALLALLAALLPTLIDASVHGIVQVLDGVAHIH